MWIIKFLFRIVTFQLVILGAFATYDQLSGGLLKDWIASHELAPLSNLAIMIYLVCPLAFFLIIVVPIRIVVAKRIGWKDWCQSFHYAGPATNLDFGTYISGRPMDQKYVQIERTLEQSGISWMTDINSLEVSDDAENHLVKLTNDSHWQKTKIGFLLEGTSTVGKTRFSGEWLRKYKAEALLLIPTFHEIPTPNTVLRKYRKQGICLFLDPLDEHEQIIPDINNFLETLHDWDIPVMVMATVGDNGYSRKVQMDPLFRPLLDRMDHFVLAPLSDDQMGIVGKELENPPPSSSLDREHTFAWLLGRQFDELKRRFLYQLSDRERVLLRAARLLDECGIEITRERWFIVVQELFNIDVDQTILSDGILSLHNNGFMYGGSPDPSHLRHVVNGDFNVESYFSKLASLLSKHKDGLALLNWGTEIGFQKGIVNDDACRHLRRALSILEASDLPADKESALMAANNLGILLKIEGKTRASIKTWKRAITLSKAATTPLSQEIAASAALSLASCYKKNTAQSYLQQAMVLSKDNNTLGSLFIYIRAAQKSSLFLYDSGNTDEANKILRETIVAGSKESSPIIQEYVALSHLFLASNLLQLDEMEQANKALQGAITFGKTSGLPMGQVYAVRAANTLSGDYLTEGKKEAIAIGMTSTSREVKEIAATAALDLSMHVLFSNDTIADETINEASSYLLDAIMLGEAADTLRGKETAVQAISRLVSNYVLLLKKEMAMAIWRKTVQMTRAVNEIGTGENISRAIAEEAALAGLNLGSLILAIGQEDEAKHVWNEVVDLCKALETNADETLVKWVNREINKRFDEKGVTI